MFSYTRSLTFYVTQFSWNFESGIYIQKAWHFALRDVFIYKKRDTSKKSRQFGLRFYLQKSWHFALRYFYRIFEIGRGGRAFLYAKNNALCVTFFYAKNNALCVTFLYTKVQTLCIIFLYEKTMHFSLCLYIYNYQIVLIPDYKCTYDQSNQIDK